MSFDFTVDRNSPKWVLGADGYLKEYIADAPAIEFNADGSYKGVLVEPQSTNDCLQSEDFSTTWFQNNSPTITTNIATAPDGTVTAVGLQDTTGTTFKSVSQIFSVSANSQITASLFVKKETAETNYGGIGFSFSGSTPKTAYFIFNSVNGTANISKTLTSASVVVEDYGDYWRFCCTATDDGSNTFLTFNIYATLSNNGTTIGVGAGSVRTYWGAQVEESPIATSYIPTTTGAVTRLKDDIYLTSASSLIGQTEGTLFVEVDWNEIAGGSQYVFQLTDGTTDNRIHLHKFNTPSDLLYFFIESGNVAQMSQGVSSTSFTGIQKIAFAYKQNDCKGYINGSEVVSDTSVDLSSLSLTELYFGQNLSALVQGNMWIRAVALFTTRLSDAEAYSLTGYDTYAQMANALQYTIL